MGSKNIVAVFLDVTSATFGDMVFDPFGFAGDDVSKPLTIDVDEGTGFVSGDYYYKIPGEPPVHAQHVNGTGGYRGLLMQFSTFSAGKKISFSIDMDCNSIALTTQDEARQGILNWDAGGVSGAELIGAILHVVFEDGSRARSPLHSDTSNAGAMTEAMECYSPLPLSLTVTTRDGIFQSGENERTGRYGAGVPRIKLRGPPLGKVRVSLMKAFQPVNGDASLQAIIEERLHTHQASWPVNALFDIQTIDVILGEDGQTSLCNDAFVYDRTEDNDIVFTGMDTKPIAFTANLISSTSPARKAYPLSAVERVYLLNDGDPVGDGETRMKSFALFGDDAYVSIVGGYANVSNVQRFSLSAVNQTTTSATQIATGLRQSSLTVDASGQLWEADYGCSIDTSDERNPADEINFIPTSGETTSFSRGLCYTDFLSGELFENTNSGSTCHQGIPRANVTLVAGSEPSGMTFYVRTSIMSSAQCKINNNPVGLPESWSQSLIVAMAGSNDKDDPNGFKYRISAQSP
uniref:Uncharacterized protein n=2 Tax=Lotharella globosa TaxID=91324 RepID=A0A7S3Z569_9EUKA